MYVFDASSGMTFDKTRGLKWYGFLQLGFFFGFLFSISMVLFGPSSFSADPELYEIFSEYVILYKIAGIFQSVFMLMLLITTIKYQYSMLRWLKAQIIFVFIWCVISYLFLFFQYGIPIDLPQLISQLIGVLLSYIINYPYLKKRWISSFSELTPNPEPSIQPEDNTYTPSDSSELLLQDVQKSEFSVSPASPSTDEPKIRFCRFCGNPLREDSMFCDKCGKKVRS